MTSPRLHRIVVGLSGGVDSAVTAWLLKRAGHEVVGIFMKNWEEDDDDEYCSSRQDFLDAASVADVIGIEIEHVNFAAEYKDRVFAEFLREYQAGRTPNPDVLCNAEIKFKAFLDHAIRLGAERIATGHYARVREASRRRFELLKGLDGHKDQSYFLHRLSQAQLARTLFPIGELREDRGAPDRRRDRPAERGKKDSTGICFIGERPFREFLNRYLANAPGPIEDDRGRTIGEHVGLSFYTLGQRKGIGIGGLKDRAACAPAASTRPGSSREGPRAQRPARRRRPRPSLAAVAPARRRRRQLDRRVGAGGGRYAAKTRYRQADAACALRRGAAADAIELAFDRPQWAVTPGQSAVLYDGEVCLGGAVIAASDAHDVAPAGAAPRRDESSARRPLTARRA